MLNDIYSSHHKLTYQFISILVPFISYVLFNIQTLYISLNLNMNN